MSPFLFHPPECEKIVDPVLGKKTLRFVEPGLEGERFGRKEEPVACRQIHRMERSPQPACGIIINIKIENIDRLDSWAQSENILLTL
jgi:hypothetical protein